MILFRDVLNDDRLERGDGATYAVVWTCRSADHEGRASITLSQMSLATGRLESDCYKSLNRLMSAGYISLHSPGITRPGVERAPVFSIVYDAPKRR